MKKTLLIVESPAKVKTIKKFLGSHFIIESSVGHVRDLPEKEFGIDIEQDFTPKYVEMKEKKKVIDTLKKQAKACDQIYLSPDPDREGEAISWHIAALLPAKIPVQRVVFHSITKKAVLDALSSPRDIHLPLVNAQQARRLLDRIVGYKLSPLLSRRVPRQTGRSLSAGRVQSVALKIVVEREKEIEAFVPVEYWKLTALMQKLVEPLFPFQAVLYSVEGKRVVKERKEAKKEKNVLTISTEEEASHILSLIKQGSYHVKTIERKEKKKYPVPPFITSTLQQEASRHFGFSSSQTMRIAQRLYEGIDLGESDREGLITYMRTDSTRTDPEALENVRQFILETYSQEYLPSKATLFSRKTAQDAHEAIRPTDPARHPDKIRSFLAREEFALYQLIWKRFIASQMKPALYDTIAIDIASDNSVILRSTGSTLTFKGFLAVYKEKQDEEKSEAAQPLPPLEEGEVLQLNDASMEQAFTRPPPRFTEASLVKELERSGIGRPSTYATIMSKIQSREYTEKKEKYLHPTQLGRVVVDLLEKHFTHIMNIGFTASLEDGLESVAEGKKEWKTVLRDFWNEFDPMLKMAEKQAFVEKEKTEMSCPKCGAYLEKIWAKSRYFYGCSKHPDCDYTISEGELNFNKADYAEQFNWEQPCPLCAKPMKIRHGKYGAFLGCTNYPKCKGIVSIPKKGEAVESLENATDCPAIDCPGKLVSKRSRYGKTFYTCSTFPQCDVVGNSPEAIEKKYVNYARVPYEKKKKNAEVTVSDELKAILGTNSIPKKEIIKKVWEYIKKHDCQDPNDKRMIIPDQKLAALFKQETAVSMLKITSLLKPHIQTDS